MADATSELAVTTELEAVNTMLRAVGESPISDLEAPQLVTAVNAKSILRRVSREVQTQGWHFNTEKNFPFATDQDGKIPVGDNVIRIDTWGVDGSRSVTRRGAFLYDLTDHTFVFTASLKCVVTFVLSFEDIPEPARNYITIKAAREFQNSDIGQDGLQFGFSDSDEFVAMASLKDFEGEHADYNILTGSYDVYRTLDRNAGAGSPVIGS